MADEYAKPEARVCLIGKATNMLTLSVLVTLAVTALLLRSFFRWEKKQLERELLAAEAALNQIGVGTCTAPFWQLRQFANRFYATDRLDDACQLYSWLMQGGDTSVVIVTRVAYCKKSAGKWSEAETLFRRAVHQARDSDDNLQGPWHRNLKLAICGLIEVLEHEGKCRELSKLEDELTEIDRYFDAYAWAGG